MEKQKNRLGTTKVTSVSVSKEFQKLIDQYNISPTECFRRGVAVTLYDLGVEMYQSKKNEDRSKYMQEFLKKVDQDEKLKQQYKNMILFEKIKMNFDLIKTIIKDLENQEDEK